MNIDLLAVSAWASVKPFPRYGRVGYEVKVSRSDYKRELANPAKRARAVEFCHEFYFAVPHGLLKPDEVTWTPPWGFDVAGPPFQRARCLGAYGYSCLDGRLRRLSAWRRGRQIDYANDRRVDAECPVCWGKGWIAESPAVRAGAPRLWIPDDVGLVVVYDSGRCVTAKKAPRRQPVLDLTDHHLADLVRWVSVRPDPRHAARP